MNSAGIRFQDGDWTMVPEHMALVVNGLAYDARVEAVMILMVQRELLARIRKNKK